MQKFNADFVADFKIGDNISYNLQVLSVLYTAMDTASQEDKNLFYKPIILQNACITEALMHDFLIRAKYFTREGIATLPERIIKGIRGKQFDTWGHYIDQFKKHKLLSGSGFDVYGTLNELRTLRNRVHIQNVQGELERDDVNAFNHERLHKSEKCLQFLLKTLSEKHSRKMGGYVDDFVLPYSSHFDK